MHMRDVWVLVGGGGRSGGGGRLRGLGERESTVGRDWDIENSMSNCSIFIIFFLFIYFLFAKMITSGFPLVFQ